MNFDNIEIQNTTGLDASAHRVIVDIRESIIKELHKKYFEWYDIEVVHLASDTLSLRSPHSVFTTMLYNMQGYFDDIFKYWSLIETQLPDNGINVTIHELLCLDGKSVLPDEAKSWWKVIRFLLDSRVHLKHGLRHNNTQIMVNAWFQDSTFETQRYNQSTLVIKKMEELVQMSQKEVYLRFFWKSNEIDSYIINSVRR